MTNKYKSIKMKASTTRHSEEGFAAVTVMVISLLGGLIVFDTVKENVNQERMAGNYSKELNARIQAENGLAAAYNELSTGSSLSAANMMAKLNNAQNDSESYRYSINAWENSTDTSITELENQGEHYEGKYIIRGSISLTSSSSSSIFTGAIVTCDGVSSTGSGTIDSYDSDDGPYDSNNANNNGDVSVIGEDASIVLSGNSPIKGSISVDGDLTLSGSSAVYGDAHVSGDISYGNSGTVYGNASAQGNISTNGRVNETDSITANGDVTLSSDYINELTYGNELVTPNYAAGNGWEVLNTAQQATGQVGDVITQDCDTLGITSEFESGDVGNLETVTSTTIDFSSAGDNNAFDYIFTSNGLESYSAGTSSSSSNTAINTESQDITFLGNDSSAYILSINDFSHGNTITIESGNDVTLYLQGDTVISDKIYVEDGATLTIITEGSFETTQDGGIYPLMSDGTTVADSAVNSNGDTSFTLYSGYVSNSNDDYGLSLSGYTDMFMTAYAPNTSVEITGSGDIYGSVWSSYLSISYTSAGVHYDEQLANAGSGSSSGSSEITITRWF